MISRKVYLLSVSFIICIPQLTFAQIVITEIMYDLKGSDSGREWVEIYNAGPTDVSLATYKLFENGTAHKISGVSGSGSLPAGSYAIIADNAANFKVDWPTYSGPLFDSAFSLSNEGEGFALRNASSTEIDTATYQSNLGGSGDGNSLNRSSAEAGFVTRAPSPGAAMSAEAIAPPPKLVKTQSAVKQKPADIPKVVEENVIESEESEVEVVAAEAGQPQVAAALVTQDTESSNSSVWWIGALVIAAFAASSLLIARRLSKTEWDIEEITETG